MHRLRLRCRRPRMSSRPPPVFLNRPRPLRRRARPLVIHLFSRFRISRAKIRRRLPPHLRMLRPGRPCLLPKVPRKVLHRTSRSGLRKARRRTEIHLPGERIRKMEFAVNVAV